MSSDRFREFFCTPNKHLGNLSGHVLLPPEPFSLLADTLHLSDFMADVALTKRDVEILETLAYRVRFFSLEQICRTWWSGSGVDCSTAQRRLNRLVKAGWLVHSVVSVPPELELEGPVFCWSPGDEEPDFYKLAWAFQKRWRELPRNTHIYYVGPAARRRFGGRAGGPKRLTQIRHDLHIGTVYLRLMETTSDVVNRWISEDDLAKERKDQKLPDGLLRATATEPEIVIEFAGAYDAEHIQSFHVDCLERSVRYQLW